MTSPQHVGQNVEEKKEENAIFIRDVFSFGPRPPHTTSVTSRKCVGGVRAKVPSLQEPNEETPEPQRAGLARPTVAADSECELNLVRVEGIRLDRLTREVRAELRHEMSRLHIRVNALRWLQVPDITYDKH